MGGCRGRGLKGIIDDGEQGRGEPTPSREDM